MSKMPHRRPILCRAADPPACSNMAIEVANLSVQFNGHAILRQIDLQIALGQTIALVGVNGAGKTTLLRCLAGLLRPNQGQVLWFGKSPRRQTMARKLVGLVAHEGWLYGELTPRENLLFAARMCQVVQPAERVEILLREAGLLPSADRAASLLSQGTRQRLAVARALVHNPPILLLDEPFAGLDTTAKQWLLSLLSNLRKAQVTICLTIHDRALAWQLADRVHQIEDGRLKQLSDTSLREYTWIKDAVA